jgi:cation transport ATPase
VTTEAADVIILIDALDRVSDALTIGKRTMRIARQSIRVGLGLSAIAMVVAAFGGLTPVIGAGLQEAIDVAVILNALRSSADPLRRPGGPSGRFESIGSGHRGEIPNVGGVSTIRA